MGLKFWLKQVFIFKFSLILTYLPYFYYSFGYCFSKAALWKLEFFCHWKLSFLSRYISNSTNLNLNTYKRFLFLNINNQCNVIKKVQMAVNFKSLKTIIVRATSRSTKWHRQAAVGHWVSLCVWSVVGWLIVYQDGNYLYPGQYSQTIWRSQIGWYPLRGGNILMARPSTFLERRSWLGHDCGKFILCWLYLAML